jgi:hypothetical protein
MKFYHVNGLTPVGYRIDIMSEDMATGLEFLAKPFAIVPKLENARLVADALNAFEEAAESRKVAGGGL